MTDTLMEKANRVGNQVDTESESKTPSFIKRVGLWISLLVLHTARISFAVVLILCVSYVAVELLTPDPWYVRILPWS